MKCGAAASADDDSKGKASRNSFLRQLLSNDGKDDDDKQKKTMGEADDVVKFVLHGQRSGKTYGFTISTDKTPADLKQMIYLNIHGHELDVDEQEFTDSHYIRPQKHNRIYDESKTFIELGLLGNDVPYDITFNINKGLGGC